MAAESAGAMAIAGLELTKRFGHTTALEKVRLQVAPGDFFGLLGPNGAGKSTLMKLVTGILEPTGGSIEVFGHKAGRNDEVRRLVGYVPQDVALYESLTAMHNLQFFGEMYSLRGRTLRKRLEEVLEFVGLTEKADEAVKTYSGGMKRRLNVAAAILHRPKLLLLDEPTVGVDPHSRNRLFEMFRRLRQEGTTIVYSSHYMEEVEELCDSVGIIDHGRLIEQDRLADLLARYAGNQVYVELPPDAARDEGRWLAQSYPGLLSAHQAGAGWLAEAGDRLELMQALLKAASEEKMDLRRLELVKPSLESVFLKLTGETLRDE